MNGGGLLAIPGALALFQAKADDVKVHITLAALMFIGGLISVVIAQAAGFFTMARRSEAEIELLNGRVEETSAAFETDGTKSAVLRASAQGNRAIAVAKTSRSNYWRLCGIAFVWLSLSLFLVGCYFGTRAVRVDLLTAF